MSKRMIRTILVLVSMLFLNIEAAQAGLVGKLKLYIAAELPHWLLVMLLGSALLLIPVLLVIFTPLYINNQRLVWHSYFTFHPDLSRFAARRRSVNRIRETLTADKNV